MRNFGLVCCRARAIELERRRKTRQRIIGFLFFRSHGLLDWSTPILRGNKKTQHLQKPEALKNSLSKEADSNFRLRFEPKVRSLDFQVPLFPLSEDLPMLSLLDEIRFIRNVRSCGVNPQQKRICFYSSDARIRFCMRHQCNFFCSKPFRRQTLEPPNLKIVASKKYNVCLTR